MKQYILCSGAAVSFLILSLYASTPDYTGKVDVFAAALFLAGSMCFVFCAFSGLEVKKTNNAKD